MSPGVPIAVPPSAATPMLTPNVPTEGDVTARQLTVERHRAGDVVSVQVDRYLPVRERDQITVDRTGRALIRFSDQVLVELFRDSSIEIARVSLEPAGSVFLELQQWVGHSHIELRSIAETRLRLTTDYATITPLASDTTFSVCQAQGVTCTVTQSGETEVQADDRSLRLHAGEGTFILEGNPPLPPVCIDVNEIRRWMDQLRGPEDVPDALVTFVQGRPEPPCPDRSSRPLLAPTVPPSSTSDRSEPISPAPTVPEREPPIVDSIHVPAGEFAMGFDGGPLDAQPMHTVYLDEFWIMQTEVTNAQYAACVAADICTAPSVESWSDPVFANHPVTGVTWHQANAYATWVGGRLPTEAEWEKAARGTDGRIYPWGNENPSEQYANFNVPLDGTVPVGSYPDGASPYGVLDMAGNAEEWVADWYDPDYYTVSPAHNPQGSETGLLRILRGGSFKQNLNDIRASVRVKALPESKFETAGFRVVMSTVQE